MTRYTVMIDGEAGAYGVVFPDMPGCTAMGDTLEAALEQAAEALRDWIETQEARGLAVPDPTPPERLRADPEVIEALSGGAVMASVLLIRDLGRPVKANLSLDSGVLAALDATARRLGVTRSALVERLAREHLPELA